MYAHETSVGGEDSGGGGGGGGGGAGGGGEMSATPGGGGGGGGMGLKSGSPSPLVGSVGRISGRDSVASLTSSTDTSCLTHPDEDIERLLQLNEKKISSLTPLGVSFSLNFVGRGTGGAGNGRERE
ncbi:hypothetical protein E2C01_081730 [Portunus trituberculatus]|uniref:Uncharacterized protein n=1 Tax=Portunus trituberculatus TaxID=210409 RepID=A0A5B7ISM7_PORTR|nr:hypothetical protein [Portunus trituberculatus]